MGKLNFIGKLKPIYCLRTDWEKSGLGIMSLTHVTASNTLIISKSWIVGHEAGTENIEQPFSISPCGNTPFLCARRDPNKTFKTKQQLIAALKFPFSSVGFT